MSRLGRSLAATAFGRSVMTVANAAALRVLAGVGFERCVLRRSVSQNVLTATQTLALWDVESTDPAGMHDLVTNPGRVTIQTTGWYRIGGQLGFDQNSIGDRETRIVKNGVKALAVCEYSGRFNGQMPFSWEGQLNAGDYIEIWCYQTSGGTRTIFGDDNVNNSAGWGPYTETELRVSRVLHG